MWPQISQVHRSAFRQRTRTFFKPHQPTDIGGSIRPQGPKTKKAASNRSLSGSHGTWPNFACSVTQEYINKLLKSSGSHRHETTQSRVPAALIRRCRSESESLIEKALHESTKTKREFAHSSHSRRTMKLFVRTCSNSPTTSGHPLGTTTRMHCEDWRVNSNVRITQRLQRSMW